MDTMEGVISNVLSWYHWYFTPIKTYPVAYAVDLILTMRDHLEGRLFINEVDVTDRFNLAMNKNEFIKSLLNDTVLVKIGNEKLMIYPDYIMPLTKTVDDLMRQIAD